MGNSCGRLGLGGDLDDRERDAFLHRLGDHYAAGRLTADELDSRIQAALAATTEAELAAVTSDLSVDHAVAEDRVQPAAYTAPAVPGTPTRSRARVAATVVVLALGGGLVAAVGQGSNLVELIVGLAVGQLGFLTHWWLSAGVEQDRPAPAPPAVAAAPDRTPVPAVPAEELPRQRDPRQGGPPVPTRRPVGRGDGSIPTQRRGD